MNPHSCKATISRSLTVAARILSGTRHAMYQTKSVRVRNNALRATQLMLSVLLATTLLTGCGRQTSKSNDSLKTLEIQTSTTHESLHFSGTVQPIRETTLTSPVDGVLEQVHYPYGQHVKKGEIVMTLNSTTLQKQYNDALTEYLKAKDNFSIAKTKFIGTDSLWKAGLIAKNNYLSEKSNLNTTRVTLIQAWHNLSELLAKTDGDSPQALDQLKLSDFDKVQAALSTPHYLIQFKAPINGVVLYPPLSGDMKTNRLSVGTTIKAGQALALIGDLSGIRVEIDIPEVDIDKIKPGLPAVIGGVAFKQHELHGELTTITSQAGVAGGGTLPSFQATVEVKHLDAQQQAWIKTGMSATVELTIHREEQLMVPIAAVHSIHGETMVRLRAADGTITEQRVETGAAKADRVAIIKGLKTGDVVVYE